MKIKWTSDMLYCLRNYYPDTNNHEVADLLGISFRTVIRKAKELGITKDKDYLDARTKQGCIIMRIINEARGYPQRKYLTNHSPNAGTFTKGHTRSKKRTCVRLDTMQEFGSIKALAENLGHNYFYVAERLRIKGTVNGIKVRYKEDI